MRPRILASTGIASLFVASCVGIAGVGDYAVDPCFDGCGDAPSGSDTGPGTDTGGQQDSPIGSDTGTDAPVDVGPDGAPPSPGLSTITLSGTGVAVGKTGVATLVTKNATGDVVPRTGAKVVFTTKGGTSVVTFGAVSDLGGGTYKATYTGLTEGTKLDVSATLDGAPLTTATRSLRVTNAVAAGLTFSLDASNADAAGNFGGKGCGGAGLGTWTDLGTSAFAGTLNAFTSPPCAAVSGWNGSGAPDNPHRLTFDGIDDHVSFGAVNSLLKQTVMVWFKKTGTGFTGTSGTGGVTNITPLVTKGTAENEVEAVDINYYLGIGPTGVLATDFEANPGSGNAPLLGVTALTNDVWYMAAMTLDSAAVERFLYLNGAQEASSATAATPASGSSSLLVVGGARRTDAAGDTCPGAAGSSGCARFKGEIAVVLTYDRALTKAEIEQNCHSFSSRFGMLTCPN